MTIRGPLSSNQTKQCMCQKFLANTEGISYDQGDITLQDSVAEYATLESVLELDQELSNLHQAMIDCSACSSDPLRTMALLDKLDILCSLYVAGQAKFAVSDHHIRKTTDADRAEIANSTFQIGRYVLDNEERKVVGRVVVKEGLDSLQKKLQVIQAEQKRAENGTSHSAIGLKVRGILSKVWEASGYGCL